MKKNSRIRLVFVAFMFAINSSRFVSAQNHKYISTSSLGIGSAKPLGSFGAIDADKEGSGGAASGFTIDYEYKIRLRKPTGFGAVLLLKNQFNDLSPEFISDAASGYYNISSGSWSLDGYMAGAFYSISDKSDSRSSIQPKLLFGLLNASDPSMYYYYRGKLLYSKYEATSLAFASLLGFDVAYDYGRLHLQTSFDFLMSKPTFNVRFDDWINYTIDYYSYAQKMRTYSLKFSLGYNFGKIK